MIEVARDYSILIGWLKLVENFNLEGLLNSGASSGFQPNQGRNTKF